MRCSFVQKGRYCVCVNCKRRVVADDPILICAKCRAYGPAVPRIPYRDRPACVHLSGPTGDTIYTTGKCKRTIELYRCDLYGDDTTLSVELPPRLCCRLCGPEDGYEPIDR